MEEKEKKQQYRVKYASVHGQTLILTLAPIGERFPFFKKMEYAKTENSIRKKMIGFYTGIFMGTFLPSYRSNIHDAAKWMLRHLEDTLEKTSECDRRYGTGYARRICNNAAAAMVHGGVWTNRDLEHADKDEILNGLSLVLAGIQEEMERTLSEQEALHAGQVKLDSCADSARYPGFTVARMADRDGGLCLAAKECVDPYNWADPVKGTVLCFADAPDGVYAALAYGYGSHLPKEAREYLQGRVAPEMEEERLCRAKI